MGLLLSCSVADLVGLPGGSERFTHPARGRRHAPAAVRLNWHASAICVYGAFSRFAADWGAETVAWFANVVVVVPLIPTFARVVARITCIKHWDLFTFICIWPDVEWFNLFDSLILGVFEVLQ